MEIIHQIIIILIHQILNQLLHLEFILIKVYDFLYNFHLFNFDNFRIIHFLFNLIFNYLNFYI